jgi:hypothetical protein
MKYYALGAFAVAVAIGAPSASGFFSGMVALSTPAQADIACGRLGCRETGRTIRRNGSYYRGLGFGSQAQGNQPKADSAKQQPR